jgi:hypothetical protein
VRFCLVYVLLREVDTCSGKSFLINLDAVPTLSTCQIEEVRRGVRLKILDNLVNEGRRFPSVSVAIEQVIIGRIKPGAVPGFHFHENFKK